VLNKLGGFLAFDSHGSNESCLSKDAVERELNHQMLEQLHPLRNKQLHEIFPVLNYFKWADVEEPAEDQA
jgi:hypothetical protein